ncbi:MAG: ferredoxin family protein [Deltaproteobacteria bacterium]|nr:MAG: ferredoxin family protein [Deltaproteobacteria bacterium]
MPPVILKHCKRCGRCWDICPGDVFHWDKKKGEKKTVPVVKYPDECWHCGACRLECPVNAIEYQFPLQMLRT